VPSDGADLSDQFSAPSAVLKGYVDRVLGADNDFPRFRVGVGLAHLNGLRLLSISASAAPLPGAISEGGLSR
jgi:hypothetical protein